MLTKAQCENRMEEIAKYLRYTSDANSDTVQGYRNHLKSLMKSYQLEYQKALKRRPLQIGV